MIRPQSLVNNRYRVGNRLGEGGMAVVYAGHDLLLGRDVAIKTLRSQFAADPGVHARFAREARAAAALSHPNIIDVYDVGEDEGTPYLVMELVHGHSLKEIIAAEAPFHADDVAALLVQVGEALDYAHARGYVHRDVKPGNILVDGHGRARIADFGIAKGLADTDLTDAGEGGFGTAAYLAPEQAEGLMATPSSDTYAAGVVAFEMLTGERPFRADTPVGLAMRHVHDLAPAPSDVVPGIPPQIDAVILRALEKDPTRRWPSAGAFARALRDWREAESGAARDALHRHREPAAKSSSLPTFFVIALVVAALAALLWAGMRPTPGINGESPLPVVVGPSAPEITGRIDEGGERETPESEPTATVEPPTQSPATGASVIQAAPTIAPVAEAFVPVPNLQGLTISGATSALLPLGLRIAQAQPVYSASVPLNAIAAQDPPPGVAVNPGETVHVTLSRGQSPFLGNNQP